MSTEGIVTSGIGAGANEFPLWLLTDGLYIGDAVEPDRPRLGLGRGAARADQRGRATSRVVTLARGSAHGGH